MTRGAGAHESGAILQTRSDASLADGLEYRVPVR